MHRQLPTTSDHEEPPTAGEIQAALLTAYRVLSPRGRRVGITVERVRLLPTRPGRAGRDVPAARGNLPVHPARVRYAVQRAAPAAGAAAGSPPAPPVVVQATYRFWRNGGVWAFTGPLAASVTGAAST